MRHALRVSKEAWEDAMRVFHGETPTHTHLRDRLISIGFITACLAIVASIAIFFIERHAKETDIHTYGDAFFWVSSQLLTVSSSLRNPITPAAQAIDLVLEFYAITVIAALAGSFAAFFHRRGREKDAEKATGQQKA